MKQTSKRQLLANQKNAKLGGVKTSEGKSISKMNAFKHGILSKEVLLDTESKTIFEDFCEPLRASLSPQTSIEAIISDRIIVNFWRLKRIIEIEKNTMEWNREESLEELDLWTSKNTEQPRRKAIRCMIANFDIDRILRYETTIERSIQRNIHELQRMQAMRRGQEVSLPIPIDIDVNNDDNGFVSQK